MDLRAQLLAELSDLYTAKEEAERRIGNARAMLQALKLLEVNQPAPITVPSAATPQG